MSPNGIVEVNNQPPPLSPANNLELSVRKSDVHDEAPLILSQDTEEEEKVHVSLKERVFTYLEAEYEK